MANCTKCKNKLGFFDKIFCSGFCVSCKSKEIEKDKLKREDEKIKQEKKDNQQKKAIDKIKKYIEHSYTLGEHSKEHYVECKYWYSDEFAVYPLGNTKKEPFVLDKEELINLVIKNDYDVKDIINQLVENKFVEVEVNKIKERQRKRNIREQAEKKLYGKVKTKRKILTEEEKELIFDKFGNECVVCGKKEGLHIHHKDKNSSNNQINNLVVLCGVCHKKTHMRIR